MRIYVDNAATTKMNAACRQSEMIPFMSRNFPETHPVFIWRAGRAKGAVEKSREQVAKAISAEPKEIYFTGSGSEADNWAVGRCPRQLILIKENIL